MKKQIQYLFCALVCMVLLSSCGNYGVGVGFRETRIRLIGTNIIGIVGEASATPYIEIQFSMADEEKPGYNKTVSIMVSPPFVFYNDRVYMTYEYLEIVDSLGRRLGYEERLLRGFEEGEAEYLKIINHSPNKQIEFFFAGAQADEINGWRNPPDVRFRNAPVYFLLFPEKKPAHNFYFPGLTIYFEGDRIGDLVVTGAWSIEDVIALYRAEYNRSNEIQLTAIYGHRLIDYIKGTTTNVGNWDRYVGIIFYGVIEPGGELRGNNKTWLLATPLGMFNNLLSEGDL
jgi:hypothetical protein